METCGSSFLSLMRCKKKSQTPGQMAYTWLILILSVLLAHCISCLLLQYKPEPSTWSALIGSSFVLTLSWFLLLYLMLEVCKKSWELVLCWRGTCRPFKDASWAGPRAIERATDLSWNSEHLPVLLAGLGWILMPHWLSHCRQHIVVIASLPVCPVHAIVHRRTKQKWSWWCYLKIDWINVTTEATHHAFKFFTKINFLITTHECIHQPT